MEWLVLILIEVILPILRQIVFIKKILKQSKLLRLIITTKCLMFVSKKLGMISHSKITSLRTAVYKKYTLNISFLLVLKLLVST